MQITSIPCDAGCNSGKVENWFTNEEVDCAECEGEGQLFPCNTFNSVGHNSAFRNQRCSTCGVRENTHNIVEKLRESV